MNILVTGETLSKSEDWFSCIFNTYNFSCFLNFLSGCVVRKNKAEKMEGQYFQAKEGEKLYFTRKGNN